LVQPRELGGGDETSRDPAVREPCFQRDQLVGMVETARPQECRVDSAGGDRGANADGQRVATAAM
jgi:hypothetical protein